MDQICTPDELIAALGGNGVVAAMYGVGATAVSNWRARGIPARLHYRIEKDVLARGLNADFDALFQVDAA